MNVTVVDGTAQSNLRLYPADTAEPLVSNMNWKAGDSATANKVDVKLSPTGQIKLANFNGTVNVIGDIVGYYTNSTLKELATGLTEANNKIAASESKIVVLEASEPFAVSNYNPDSVFLTTAPTSVLVDVIVTAPVDGQVTVNYSTFINNATLGAESVCAPFRSTEISAGSIAIGDQGIGFWETAVAGNGDEGSLSRAASLDIAAGTTVTCSLACQQSGGSGRVAGRTMTAIFTPTP
jgi:hypothetical protein